VNRAYRVLWGGVLDARLVGLPGPVMSCSVKEVRPLRRGRIYLHSNWISEHNRSHGKRSGEGVFVRTWEYLWVAALSTA